jgi:hypothetical protein
MRRAFAHVPTAAWVCAVLAFANAVCWSLITPPFQSSDEPDHFAYVQLLAENDRLPSQSLNGYSQEQTVALTDLRNGRVRFRPEGRPISSVAQQQALQRDLAWPLSRQGSGGAGLASTEPPLYYALETIPYALASSGSILDRLELMRLLTAVMGALTALFASCSCASCCPGSAGRGRWEVSAWPSFPCLGSSRAW